MSLQAYNEYVAQLYSAPAPRNVAVTAPPAPDACPKCKGTGRFISFRGRDCGPCFACNGTGKAAGAANVLAQIAMVKELCVLPPVDLRELPSGTYAVPGGDTRLKVRVKRPGKQSKWHGYIFVDDGAEYGKSQRYGSQRPGAAAYVGKIEDQLRAILADPFEAVTAYGKLVGVCGVCGRHLEDAESVAKGIGPICEGRFTGGETVEGEDDAR